MKCRSTLLASAAITLLSSPALSQQSQPTGQASQSANQAATQPSAAGAVPTDEYGDEQPIVVTGQRARGSAIGDIPPENTLNAGDVRATGATNINDLLDALAPQIGSSQGRGGEPPVILLNGERIASFRELRDIPTEAIERVDILPEEVALKYGYRADQKVVNIVLRQRFRSTTAQIGAGGATDGGYSNANADLTRFMIEKNGRTTLNLHAQGNTMLTEAERNIILTQAPPGGATPEQELAARSLVSSGRDLRASGTFNRKISTDVDSTLNTEVEHKDGLALIGLGNVSLLALGRNTSTDSAHAGFSMNGTRSQWHWTLTSDADLQRDTTSTARDELNGGRDRARETTESGDVKATANGKLLTLPGGDASTTITLAGNTEHLQSERRLLGVTNSHSLGRTTGEAAMNLDIPISRRNHDFSALGNLTLNGNVEVDHLSDFGTLTTVGAGANWSPVDRLTFLSSWTSEQGPPTINQLGDPVITTPGTRIFDFTTGQTVIVTSITGGNPNLHSDHRRVLKLGANWQPFENTDLRLRGEYVHQTIDRPIANISVTPTMEAAFPDRFVRNAAGQLVSVDFRPVNFESSQRDALRIGFDFTKPLKSHRPSQAVIDQMRAQFGVPARGQNGSSSSTSSPNSAPAAGAEGSRRGAESQSGAPPSNSQAGPPASGNNEPGGGFRGGRFGGRGGGFFGGRNRGRLMFSFTDNITFVEKVKVVPGLPEIDYLHGEAAGQTGGTPRHQIEAQAGYYNNGLGARVTANWRSATTVDTLNGNNLHFSPVATFDLRLFDNLGDQPEVVLKHPWLRGAQVQLQLNNMFNSRPDVRDSRGNVPLNYQPDLLEPLGRTVMISFRKLFLPSPSWFRRQFQEMRQRPSS